MGTIGREALRNEAKKIYKENTKNIPKRNRIPFSQFFKEFKKMKRAQHAPADVNLPQEIESPEDFNFEDLININEISDDTLEVTEDEVEAESEETTEKE